MKNIALISAASLYAINVQASDQGSSWTLDEGCLYIKTTSLEDKDLILTVSSYDVKGQVKAFTNLFYLPNGKLTDDDQIIKEGVVVGAINGKNVEIKYQQGSKGSFSYMPNTVKGNNYISSILKGDEKITFKILGNTRTFNLSGFDTAFKEMRECKPI